jgi:D-amino-acid dehydrogenase
MLTPSMADPWNAPGVFRHLLASLGHEDSAFLLRLSALPSMLRWGISFLAQARPARYRVNMEKNLRLASYSVEILQQLRTQLGLEYDALAQGTIKVFRDAQAFDAGVARNAILRELGLDVRAVDAAEAVRIEPALGPVREKIVGAMFCPADESGDARAFTQALARQAQDRGVKFVFGAEVGRFEVSGDRVVSAIGSRGTVYPGDAFVLAAGSWSPQLLAPLNFSLRVRPVKGYSITVPFSGWQVPPRMPVIDDALHAAATPLGERLRVAGTAEICGYDTTLKPARIDNLFKLLLDLFPDYAPFLDRANASPWAGLRPVCADGVPLLGRYRCRNLFLNTGHGHLGWTLAAGSARILADLMLDKVPEIDAGPYDAQRAV